MTQLITHMHSESLYFRRAFRTSLAVFCSVFIYRYFSITQGFWVPLTVVIVMQATTAATLRKGLQRFVGTLIGIIIGSLLALYIHNQYIVDICLIAFLFIAYYLKAFNLINYGIFVVPLTVMVVFLVSALVPEEAPGLILARLYDTSLGAVVAIIFTVLIFPNTLKDDFQRSLNRSLAIQADLIYTALQTAFSITKKKTLFSKQNKLGHILSHNRRMYLDYRYEPCLSSHRRKQVLELLKLIEKASQFVFSLNHFARQAAEIYIPPRYEENISQLITEQNYNLKNQIIEFEKIINILSEQCSSSGYITHIVNDLLNYVTILKQIEQILEKEDFKLVT